jgi:anti-sigma factor RsiW
MSGDTQLRRALQAAVPPGSMAAEHRARMVLTTAFVQRRPAQRALARGLVPALAAAAAALAVIAVAVTPPGAAVARWVKDQLGIDAKSTHPVPALGALPGGGRVLVTARNGLWVVHDDGSRRRLGAYRDAGASAAYLQVLDLADLDHLDLLATEVLPALA